MLSQGNRMPAKLLRGWIAVLFLTAASGCGASATAGSGAAAKPAAAMGNPAPAPSGTGNAAPAEKTYRVGETAQLFDIKVTVDDVQTTDSFDQQVLEEGKQFALVKVTLENAGKDKQHYHYASFQLISSSSSKPDLNVTTLNNQTELHEGDLAPGEKASGIIPFEHPNNDPVMKLRFQPNMMSQQTIEFQLK